MRQVKLGETIFFHFATNNTAGSGDDGAETAAFDVRLAGAANNGAPVYSESANLLSHANYPPGCYEIVIDATGGNGFAVEEEYAVFCTLLVDSQNPTGFVGSFQILANAGEAVAHFTNQATNGFSTVDTLTGEYIIHIDGVFDGATVTLWGGLVGQSTAEFSNLREFTAPTKRKFTYAGDIRFEISSVTDSSITVIVQALRLN